MTKSDDDSNSSDSGWLEDNIYLFTYLRAQLPSFFQKK